jgi:hypothetical protein
MLPVWKTGVHSHELVTGTSKSGVNENEGTTFEIEFEDMVFLPPSRDWYKPENEAEDRIMIRDRVTGFLKTMEFEDRWNWIQENMSAEHYISDYNARIRFLSISGAFLKLKNEDQVKLNSHDWLPMSEVMNMFPRKPGSKAKRHTLIFRGSIWAVQGSQNEVEADVYYDLVNAEFMETKSRDRVCLVDVNGVRVGVCDGPASVDYGQYDEDIEKRIQWFTPGILKSVIQKSIRVFPVNVAIGDRHYPTEDVLLTAFLMLMNHPGSFVPDLRAFVRGSESALKRLAISAIEDSYMPKERVQSLFLGALAARTGWVFSDEYVQLCCQWALETLTPSYLVYDWRHLKSTELDDESQLLLESLTTLGSFETDVNMVRSCLENDWIYETPEFHRYVTMDVQHAFDHHCTTDVVYLLDIPNIHPEDAVRLIWDESSALNPRKRIFEINEDVKTAQTRYWLLKTEIPVHEELSSGELELPRRLDDAWIAGEIGPIEHRVGGSAVQSFFHPDDVSAIVTIRAPSRAKDQPQLTEDELKTAELFVRQKFSRPVRIKDERLNIDNDFVFEDGFFIIVDNERVPWSDYCSQTISLPTYDGFGYTNVFDEHLAFMAEVQSDFVNPDWETCILEYIRDLPPEFPMRLSVYLRTIAMEIAPYKIGRDGKGTYESVNAMDAYVFRFLCLCCYLIPAAIELKHDRSLSLSFTIKNVSVWNRLRSMIFELTSSAALNDWSNEVRSAFKRRNLEYHGDWSLSEFDDRTLRDHQRQAVERIMSRSVSGKRGNIIWIPVGGGKTFIVVNVLFELMKRCAMPEYVVYSLPPSAFESVINEFRRSDVLPVHIMDVTKTGQKRGMGRPKPFHVNFIKHDGLRVIREELLSISSRTYLILDEFHMMMDTGTQRTSVALELSKTANDFIAMTGTLIKDKDPQGIIEWVGQTVEIELTDKNYTVAVASTISNVVDHGIHEEYTLYDAGVPEGHPYWSMVDASLGGTAPKTDFRNAVNVCYGITEECIFEIAMTILTEESNVFVVALNSAMQARLRGRFENEGKCVFSIDGRHSINMTPGTHTDVDVVITTVRHSAGYNLTAIKTLVQGVYFSNQATRTQLVGRLVRMGQPSPTVDVITVHCGILSYTLRHYESARSLEKALSDLAKGI